MKFLLTIGLVLVFTASAIAQAVDMPTTNRSVLITTGGTYQQIMAAVSGQGQSRRSLTIENNLTTSDNCYVVVGGSFITAGTTTKSTGVTVNGISMTAQQGSILLQSGGGSYQRYYPYVPSDAIYATCDTTGDSLYVDTQ